MNYKEEAYLIHFGVLGMKWGRKSLKNPDGTISDSNKKKLSKQYKKLAVKTTNAIAKRSQDRYVEAYNKTADEYNNGKTDAYNKKNKVSSSNYESKYQKQFEKDLNTKYNKMVVSEILANKHYKKAQALVKEYNMTTFDQLAKANEDLVRNGG